MELCVSVDWARQRFCLHEPLKGVIRWRVKLDEVTIVGENMAVTVQAGHDPIGAALVIEDSKGNPALVDGVPEWVTSDPEGLTLAVAADGMSAVVTIVGKIGVYQVTVTCDADLGEGVKPITGVGEVEVVAGEAAVVKVQFTGVEPDPVP